MPIGAVGFHITTLPGQPLHATVEIDLEPLSAPGGTGGVGMTASAAMGGATDLNLTGIECIGGIGTRYMVTVRAKHYCPYSFFQTVIADQSTPASDQVELWVDPSAVKNIKAPAFDDLAPRLQRILESARMFSLLPEDQDIASKQGSALYRALGPLRKAALLNIFKKASHRGTTENCARFIRSLMLCRQDRVFAMVEPTILDFLRRSVVFKSALNTLHDPLPDFELEESFKSRDAHANLQITLMRHRQSGLLAADLDIDESSGIEHGFEVVRNAVFHGRTNPYVVREFLIVSDPIEKTLDPGYDFVF